MQNENIIYTCKFKKEFQCWSYGELPSGAREGERQIRWCDIRNGSKANFETGCDVGKENTVPVETRFSVDLVEPL